MNTEERKEDHFRVYLKTKFLCPGMILKWDVYSEDGEIVIPAGYKIRQPDIDTLLEKNILDIYYKKSGISSRTEDETPAMPLKLFAKAINVMDEIKEAANTHIQLPEKAIEEVVDNFIESIVFASGDAVINLLELKEHDDLLYNHAINTAVISIAFAKELGYNGKGIKIVGVGALLHNIGALFVPKELLDREGDMNAEELELIRRIPMLGYELVKSQTGFGPLVQRIILFHNERYDGTGFPIGIRGSQIGELPQVVSIASTYNTFLSGRTPGEEKKPVWYALNMTERLSGNKFVPILVKAFITRIPPMMSIKSFFPLGIFVELNTGEIGEVIALTQTYPHRPTVNIYMTEEGAVQYPIPLHLRYDNSRYIRGVVTDEKKIDTLKRLKKKFNLPSTLHRDENIIEEIKRETKPLHIESKIRAKANFFKIDPDLLESDETNLR